MAAPHETLEALVKDELRGPVGELVEQVVRELVRERLNGSAPTAQATSTRAQASRVATSGPAAAPASPKRVEGQTRAPCSRCGERPRMKERTICRRCKTRADRERHGRTTSSEEVEQEPPRPAEA